MSILLPALLQDVVPGQALGPRPRLLEASVDLVVGVVGLDAVLATQDALQDLSKLGREDEELASPMENVIGLGLPAR